MPFFSRVFRSKDSGAHKKISKAPAVVEPAPAKPKWTDAWQRTEVAPEEVQELVRSCSQELKARALDTPFLLLPFRPSSDPSAARTFVRNYFNQSFDKGVPVSGDSLLQELRLNEPMVICSVLKWCWSRLPGGVVTWEAYELFKVGEQDSDFAPHAFSTFIPMSFEEFDARTKIVFDFFDLLASIAAHGKSNGLGGRKLSRYAGWWAFEHVDTGNGFEASYKNWAAAADATSHLFFAYLRSLTPDVPRGVSGISSLPISLQTLVEATEYPPETPSLLQITTTKVVMIVDTVSPTPFALLRRARNFEYRDSDRHLQDFASFEDPTRALADECLRVLKCISSTNESSVSTSKHSTSLRDASWSRFEDVGFGASIESDQEEEEKSGAQVAQPESAGGMKSAPQSGGGGLGRPTTPSWADFMSSGFGDEANLKDPVGPLLLPPDKVLPPIAATRGQSSQSHKRTLDSEPALEPAELASISTFDLDDSFWWVWISSLSGEEPSNRKAVFGRCALLETIIKNSKWLVLEEQVKGAAPEPEVGAQIVEKKRFFSFGSRNKTKLSRRKSSAKKVSGIEESYKRPDNPAPQSKTSIGPDQHKRIQAAAAALQKKHREQEAEAAKDGRANAGEERSAKTNSVSTLQPGIVNEASQALKWAHNYDKNAFRSAYLSNSRAGTGAPAETLASVEAEKPSTPLAQPPSTTTTTRPPPPPKDAVATPLPPSPEPPKHAKLSKHAKAVKEAAPEDDKNATAIPAEEKPAEPQTQQSQQPGEDTSKKLKKKVGTTGIKSMFGAGKKKTEQPAMKTTGAKESSPSSVAAARAALEAKAKAAQEPLQSPTKLPQVKKPAAEPAVSEPVKPATPVAEPVVKPQTVAQPVSPSTEENSGPPKTRRAVEYDALSRVDTNERDAADQEFSKFDQGPLVEQPAFAQEDPVEPEPAPAPVAEKTAPEMPTNSHGTEQEAVGSSEAAASQDKWAQARKNAAEPAGAPAEEPETRTSQSERTDEGDTSGEETIESRVARIKARVAELTGNVESGKQQ